MSSFFTSPIFLVACIGMLWIGHFKITSLNKRHDVCLDILAMYVTPALSRISLLLRGTLQKFIISLCLFVILGRLVSESESKPVSECLTLVSESALKVSELVSKLVSECLSLVSKLPLTWLLSSVAWLLSLLT